MMIVNFEELCATVERHA